MSAYIVFSYTVTDPEKYQAYLEAVSQTIEQHNVQILAVGSQHKILEGTPAQNTVILKFESKEAAEAWYNSPEYQAAAKLRQAISTEESWVVLAEGRESD